MDYACIICDFGVVILYKKYCQHQLQTEHMKIYCVSPWFTAGVSETQTEVMCNFL